MFFPSICAVETEQVNTGWLMLVFFSMRLIKSIQSWCYNTNSMIQLSKKFLFDLNENYNPEQNFYNRIEKSNKTGQDKKVWYLLFRAL